MKKLTEEAQVFKGFTPEDLARVTTACTIDEDYHQVEIVEGPEPK